MQAGLEASNFSHGLGATFLDVNGDGRPDLYVANDEDPNQLYVNVPWPGGAKADPAGLGFRFENRAAASGVADPYAGMGVAVDGGGGGRPARPRSSPTRATSRRPRSPGRPRPRSRTPARTSTRRSEPSFAGWGDSFVDLAQLGQPGPRARDRRHPGHEPEEGRRAGEGRRADLRPGRHAIRRREGRRARRAARERARARGGRRRQRRPYGDRGQLDRRQAPPA